MYFTRALLCLILPAFVLSVTAQEHLTGRVRTPDGNISPNAAITLRLAGSESSIDGVTTDERGRFRIEAKSPGIYELQVTVRGYPDFHLSHVPISETRELPPIFVGKSQGRVTPRSDRATGTPIDLHGQILDPEGRAIRNALVWHDSAPERFALTDEKGRFEIEGAGKGWLRAEVAGFLPQARRVVESKRDIRLTMDRASTLAGRVVDPSGDSISEVELVLHQLDDPWEPRPERLDKADGRAFSAADGTFYVPRLEPGGSYVLKASRPGFRGFQMEVGGPLLSDEAGALRMTMDRNRPAFGWVVDAEERAVAGAEVTLRPVGRKHRLGKLRTAQTGEDGRFDFEQTPARFELFVRKEGYAPLRVRGIDLPSDKTTAPFDAGTFIMEPGAAIRGVIRDVEEHPVQGASLWIHGDLSRSAWDLVSDLQKTPPVAETDQIGRFEIKDLPTGARFHVVVGHADYMALAVEAVEAPTTKPLELLLESGLSVSGWVMDASTRPVPGARVVIEPSRDLIGATEVPLMDDIHRQTAVADGEGVFRFTRVAAGQLVLTATARGYLPSANVHLDTRAENSRSDLRLTVRRGAVLVGRVTTSAGDPVAGARIEAGTSRAFSDIDGDFRLEGVATGKTVVEARHRVYAMVQKTTEIKEGVSTLDIQMLTGHTLSGRAVGADGGTVRAALELRSEQSRERHRHLVFTDDEGHFQFEEVAEGSYRLEAHAEGYASTFERMEVVGPKDTLEIVLPPDITLTGEIRGLEFDELADLAIKADHSSRQPLVAEIDFDGRYTLHRLAPGDWRLRAQTRDGKRQIETFIALGSDQAEVRRDLVFGEGHLLSGRVIHGDEPLSGAKISVQGLGIAAELGALTDHEGRFELADVSPGRYRVGVSDPRKLVIQNRDIELVGDLDLLFDISTVVVSGRVFSAVDGQPLDHVMITLVQRFGSDDASVFSSPTDGEGFFGFPRIPPGSFRLSLSKPGYAARQQPLEVTANQEPLRFELEPTPGLDLLPTYLASNRQPSYVSVALLGGDGLLRLKTTGSVTAGRVHLPTIPPGSWRLLVQAPGSSLVELSIETPGDPVSVVLPPGGRLSLRVPPLLETATAATARLSDEQGRPLRSFDTYGAPTSAWRVEAGLATIEGVPAGQWIVKVETETGDAWQGIVVTDGRGDALATGFVRPPG